jgi:hypothetical protein
VHMMQIWRSVVGYLTGGSKRRALTLLRVAPAGEHPILLT